MALRHGLAAALRAIRTNKQLAQTDLSGVLARSYVQLIEQAKSDITIGKLEDLGEGLGLDALTILVLSASVDREQSIDVIMRRIEKELADFQQAGGLSDLASQVEIGPVQARINEREQRRASVQECRAAGLTQRETAEKLKMAKSTVADFWNAKS